MKNILPVITNESLARNRVASLGLRQREVEFKHEKTDQKRKAFAKNKAIVVT